MQGPPIWQRLLAALLYALPWADAVPFGRALFGLFPALQWLTLPALPLALLQNQIPFGGFVLFLVLFLAVVRNPQVPYLIRFNALQAILIDIVLILVSLAFNVLLAPLGGGFALRTLSNTDLPGHAGAGAVRRDPVPAGQGSRHPQPLRGRADAAPLSRRPEAVRVR